MFCSSCFFVIFVIHPNTYVMNTRKFQILAMILLVTLFTSCKKDSGTMTANNTAIESIQKPASPIPSLVDKCIKIQNYGIRQCLLTGFSDYQQLVTIQAIIYHPSDVWYIWFIFGGPSGSPISIPKIAPYTYELTIWKYDPYASPCTKTGTTINPTYELLKSAGIIQTNPSTGDYINCSTTYPSWWNYSIYPTYPGSSPWTSPHFYIGCCDTVDGPPAGY